VGIQGCLLSNPSIIEKKKNSKKKNIYQNNIIKFNLYLYYMDLVMISMEVVLDNSEDTA